MNEIIKYSSLAIVISCIYGGYYYNTYENLDAKGLIISLIIGLVISFIIYSYYKPNELNDSDDTNEQNDTNDITKSHDEKNSKNSDTWITMQTITSTDNDKTEYYGRRFNLTTGEILTKGDPKASWIVMTHLKNEELNRLQELANDIIPYSLTDDNIIKTPCDSCISDTYSLMISLQKDGKMSVLKSIFNKIIITTNDNTCIKLTELCENIDHIMPYWLTSFDWN
jgi:hypothetical protein